MKNTMTARFFLWAVKALVGLPYLIVSGVWRNFQFLHICVTFNKFSALNPGWLAVVTIVDVPYPKFSLSMAVSDLNRGWLDVADGGESVRESC